MAAEVIQGHDSTMVGDDINNSLGHSSLVEGWFAMLTQLLLIHESMSHSTVQSLNLLTVCEHTAGNPEIF